MLRLFSAEGKRKGSGERREVLRPQGGGVTRQLSALHVLKNLPVFRWADFPVSLLSFVSRWSALRLVGLRPPHRRLRVTFNRSSPPKMRAYQPAGGRRSMAPHAARPPGRSRKGALRITAK